MTNATEPQMIQGARFQYRAYFIGMACGGRWHLYRAAPGETLSGVILAPEEDMAHLQKFERPAILVNDVQSMAEETMVNALSQSVRTSSKKNNSKNF